MGGAGTAPAVVAVACSGGRDSTALLHAVWRLSAGSDLQVVALHVHHGLQPEADAWVRHLARQVQRWARRDPRISLRVARLQGSPRPAESVEAWARRERYAALAVLARGAGATTVLLGHHRRDQAETVMLQALRGAGPAGLAAMPRQAERAGLHWCRPWLDQPADAVAAYVRRHRLSHVEDASNADRRFDRNRLRHAVWPVLEAAFPGAETAMAEVARAAQDAAALAEEVAAADAVRLGATVRTLPLGDAWQALSPVRQRLLLRIWLRQACAGRAAPPGAGAVARLWQDLSSDRAGQWTLPGGVWLSLYRGCLWLRVAAPGADGDGDGVPWPVLQGPQTLEMPDGSGRLSFEPVEAGGLSLDQLRGACLRRRQGGERFQAGPGRPPRSLKKQYQAAGVPAWARHAPLLWSAPGPAPQLLFVPGLGVDARCANPAGGPQWRPIWQPKPEVEGVQPLE